MLSTRKLHPRSGKRCTIAITHRDNGAPDKLCGAVAVLDVEGCPTCRRHARAIYGYVL